MKQPKIKSIVRHGKFRYLWLKYVRGVNLNVHCAKCLLGDYSKQVSNDMQPAQEVSLDEYGARYYYLCGVALPYKWENNFHLAFVYCEGETISVNRHGIEIEIENAIEIAIQPISAKDNSLPHAEKKEYYTCRNWQFAVAVKDSF
jgi:hypothetical protein